MTTGPPVDDALVQQLDDAVTGVRDGPNAGATDVAAAYAVQEAVVARRLARGATQVGWKLGFTSLAKMAQMGVSDVILAGAATAAVPLAPGSVVEGRVTGLGSVTVRGTEGSA